MQMRAVTFGAIVRVRRLTIVPGLTLILRNQIDAFDDGSLVIIAAVNFIDIYIIILYTWLRALFAWTWTMFCVILIHII